MLLLGFNIQKDVWINRKIMKMYLQLVLVTLKLVETVANILLSKRFRRKLEKLHWKFIKHSWNFCLFELWLNKIKNEAFEQRPYIMSKKKTTSYISHLLLANLADVSCFATLFIRSIQLSSSFELLRALERHVTKQRPTEMRRARFYGHFSQSFFICFDC